MTMNRVWLRRLESRPRFAATEKIHITFNITTHDAVWMSNIVVLCRVVPRDARRSYLGSITANQHGEFFTHVTCEQCLDEWRSYLAGESR